MLISSRAIISQSFSLYTKHLSLFLRASLLLFLPSLLIVLSRVASISLFQNGVVPVSLNVGIFFILFLFFSIIAIWYTLLLTRVVAARYVGDNTTSITTALKETRPLVFSAIGASILATLISIGGFFLFFIPGFIFSLWFIFALYAIAIDKQKAIASLKTSKHLVQGRWWAVLWRFLVPLVLFVFLAFLVQTALKFLVNNTLVGILPDTIAFIILSSLTYLTASLFAPFTTTAQTILYLSLKQSASES
ncbi:MAG: hypothetical protein HN429_02460 [Candidatus Magasanikbacteria bacterium]|nr:hypothetical protein [Candidatus Magasanikbacteria bacterium]